MSLNLNEMAAMELVLKYVPLNALLQAAMEGFAEKKDIRSKENSDICFKAIDTFLTK